MTLIEFIAPVSDLRSEKSPVDPSDVAARDGDETHEECGGRSLDCFRQIQMVTELERKRSDSSDFFVASDPGNSSSSNV